MKKKKRLIFCTHSSIYSSHVLETLLRSESVTVVGIINSTRVLKPSYSVLTGSLKLIQITGWRYATYLFLVTDLFQLLQPIASLKTVHNLAKEHNIPILDTQDVNLTPGLSFVKVLAPDILLSAHFNQLFKVPLLRLPKLAAINIHPSLLPANKGVDPAFYALFRQDKQLGVTLHLMDESFDTGVTLSQFRYTTNIEDNVFAHNLRLFKAGADIALKSINKLKQPLPQQQQQGAGNYDSWPDRKRVKKLRKQHCYLIKLSTYLRVIRNKLP